MERRLQYVNLLSFLKKDKALDRMFVITSTYESNKPLFHFLKLPVDKDDVYHPDEDPKEIIESIFDKVSKETREYDDYMHRKYLHEQMRRATKKVKTDRDIGNLDPALLIATHDEEVLEGRPKHRYNGKKPVLRLFIDDCQSTKLFRTNKFLNMCIYTSPACWVIRSNPHGIERLHLCPGLHCNTWWYTKSHTRQRHHNDVV